MGKQVGKKRNEHRVENRPMYEAMVGLRSSSAASPHTPKPKKGTRGNRKREAILDFD